MNLYHVSQTANNDYDTFDSFVVCCESKEEARNTCPATGEQLTEMGWRLSGGRWTTRIEDVKVWEIGVASADVPRGIICASFNAG